MKIAIIDYGMGNLRSIINAFDYLGFPGAVVTYESTEIRHADRVILPGVGHFATAMKRIRERNLDSILFDAVVGPKKPLLGICLGMQLMALSSTEGGLHDGLGYVQARLTEFEGGPLKVPHVGFNQVKPPKDSRLYKGLSGEPDFYFVHSYQMQSTDNIGKALCNYISPFIASFETENLAGVQFHPELSQTNGLKLLLNFIKEY